MSGKVVPLERGEHEPADALLPWYVGGTLADDERHMVEQHLVRCSRCRREVEMLRQVREAVAALEGDPAEAQVLFDRVRARMERERRRRPSARLARAFARLAHAWHATPRALRWGAGLPAAAAMLLAVFLAAPTITPEPAYRTLGDAPPRAMPADAVVVVFDPAVSRTTLLQVLDDAGARVVDGPTRHNAYIVTLPPGRREVALAALRHRQDVLLAEPVASVEPR